MDQTMNQFPQLQKRTLDIGHIHLKSHAGKGHLTQSGQPLVASKVLSHSMFDRELVPERHETENQLAIEKYKRNTQKAPSYSGLLMLPTQASLNSLSAPIRSSGDSLEDKSKANVVQLKAPFSVTSEDVDLVKDIPLYTSSLRSSQWSPLRKSTSVGDRLVHTRQLVYQTYWNSGLPLNHQKQW